MGKREDVWRLPCWLQFCIGKLLTAKVFIVAQLARLFLIVKNISHTLYLIFRFS